MLAPANRWVGLGLAFLMIPSSLPAQEGRKIEFNRDIRPILSNNCFVCHGPDSNLRKAKLRLDDEADAHKKVIVKGEPLLSEFFRRLVTDELGERMPPPRSKKHLTKQEIQLIFEWIEQGARYESHWSLIPPRQYAAPAVKNTGWVKNDIDRFILAKLEAEKVAPSPEADPRTLLRRLSYDLVGLPPTPEQVESFVKEYTAAGDKRDVVLGKQVDRLLRSNHFGERMAVHWLDIVRYADTNGYHSDTHRDLYLYRDWVIEAFNSNKPFREFAVEQIAGDLLPNATNEQRIASGHNRLLQTTEEGGSQPKEYIAKYAADRVRNFGVGWLGVTLGCTECHDHKYDPFTTKEFYKLAAFFADIQETPVGKQPQTSLMTKSQQDEVKKIEDRIALLQQEIAKLPKDQAKEQQKQLGAAQKQKAVLVKSAPSTLVTTPTTPRMIRVLKRGNWLDNTGEVVTPDVPAALPALFPTAAKLKKDDPKKAGARPTRLDLAHWLVAPENPLTDRVFVNRLWMLYFGQGIVKTADDFGALGAWPTHPELLDWLALDFQKNGGDIKRSIKQMIMSAAYRQSSKGTPEMRQRDPYNQLVARQARYRIDAEFVRDGALAISGLLVHKIGGPSVKPYQPAGYWQYLNFPKREWANDKGDSQYRRGLYTYWQRTFLQPSLLAFDASTREECTVERPRSNTPQQALVLLNDPTYVEASRLFAERIIRSSKKTPDRINIAFHLALQRDADARELAILTNLYEKHRTHYEAHAKAAQALLGIGYTPAAKDLPPAELAAWTSVARTILNLHETITRN